MELQTIKTNMELQIRTEVIDNQTYLVAPTVMINQGVHHGSAGPLFYPAEELKKTVEAWNHKPVLVRHPELAGKPASSCDPKVLESQKVGFLLNASFEDDKLKAEIYLDKVKADKVDRRVVANLLAGNMMEVSTGLFTDDKPVNNAEWKGEKYIARTLNYRPDHLAILLDAKGACSTEDGAGFPRLNQKAEEQEKSILGRIIEAVTNVMKGSSHNEIRRRLLKALEEANANTYIYITDVFDKYVIYEKQPATTGLGTVSSSKLYKSNWKETKTGFEIGDTVEVIRKVSYEPVKDKVLNEDTSETGVQNKQGEQGMKREEVIESIITNEQSPFGDDERQVLNEMTDS